MTTSGSRPLDETQPAYPHGKSSATPARVNGARYHSRPFGCHWTRPGIPGLILQPEIVILLVSGGSGTVEPAGRQGGHR